MSQEERNGYNGLDGLFRIWNIARKQNLTVSRAFSGLCY